MTVEFPPLFADSFPLSNSLLIGNALKKEVSSIDPETCLAGEEDAFFVCDLGQVKRLMALWQENLPQVKPFYAVKCNNDPQLLSLLNELDTGFDCASKEEIDTVLKMGVSPDRIVFANPCKSNSYIRHSNAVSVDLTTFDNAEELRKMAKFHPQSKLLLRIATDDESAQCRLSTKFGAVPGDETRHLLKLAASLKLNVAGVAFHIGSGASDFTSIVKAVKDAKFVFQQASEMGYNCDILDVGGGFDLDSFQESSTILRKSVESVFPKRENPRLQLIAEPGRFFSASAFTLATHVIAKRHAKGAGMIYLNDGLYGNLNCIMYDHQNPVPKVLTHNGRFTFFEEEQGESGSSPTRVSIWGPTCDGLDCISKGIVLNYDPHVGDWIYFSNIGAYTSAASTSFNGFTQRARVVYVDSGDL